LRPTTLLLSALLAVVGTSDASGQSPLAVDGLFEDWELPENLPGDPGAGLGAELAVVGVRSDSERATFLLQVGTELNLQGENEITLLVDTDADPATGRSEEGLGADFGWTFGRREGRAWSGGDAWKVDQSDIGLLQAPTVSSRVFEVSFLRRSVSGHDVSFGPRIEFVLVADGGDRFPREGSVSVSLSDDPPPAALPVALERRDTSHVRVVTWNVLFDGLFKRPAPFIRVLRALDPDVVCFQEIWGHSAREAADYVSLAVPDGDWHGTNSDEGHIVSRFPISEASEIDEAGNYWALVDLPDDLYAVDLSVVCAHPPCCEKEVERQEQLDGIAAWTRDTMAPGPPATHGGAPERLDLPWGTPVVIAGDMNLVGGANQVLTLTHGRIADEDHFGPSFAPDWDGTPFSDSWARRAGGVSVATWRDRRSAFAPGKLDYIVYSDSVLRLESAFVLATEELDAEELSRYGLRSEDPLAASDHLPVVADFTPLEPPPQREAGE